MSHTRFHRVGRLHKGYHCRQVDHFLNHVEVSLNGVFPPPTADEIRQVGFELVHHGYDVTQVDEHLDGLEERVLALQAAAAGRRGRVDTASEAAYLRDQLAGPYMRRFPRAGPLRRGYERDDVDDFVDRVLAALDGQGEVSVEQVRRAPFRPKRGGYREDAVDDAMDRVVEHLMEVRRQAGRRPEPPLPQRAYRQPRPEADPAG